MIKIAGFIEIDGVAREVRNITGGWRNDPKKLETKFGALRAERAEVGSSEMLPKSGSGPNHSYKKKT